MGLPGKTASFMALLWCASPLCMLGSPKITISHRPREDPTTRMRDHEKLGSYSKLRTL